MQIIHNLKNNILPMVIGVAKAGQDLKSLEEDKFKFLLKIQITSIQQSYLLIFDFFVAEC